MTRRSTPPPHHVPLGHLHLLGVLWMLTGAVAHAQAMGQGLISYAQPIILFLGLGAVVVALVAAVFKPEVVKSAVWAAIILTVIFFVLRNASALTSAVSGG